MSARKVVFALAGAATGTVLLIGAKGAQTDVPMDQATGTRKADISGVPVPSGTPVAGDYTVTGTAVRTPFGPVEVRVVFAGGKIDDIVAVETPTDHELSIELNKIATPSLRKETLTAQSAKIDVVSGATYTSDAYAQSLQAALDRAALGQHD